MELDFLLKMKKRTRNPLLRSILFASVAYEKTLGIRLLDDAYQNISQLAVPLKHDFTTSGVTIL
jgi:hypothetical protein